jgi:predicted O-methyltransferase YrrM
MLSKWCLVVKPKKILEYGPGESTRLMRMICPKSEIRTIEHDAKWFNVWIKELADDKTHVVLAESPEDDRTSLLWDKYVEQRGMYDLIFIDGRERVKCLNWAKDHINPNGVVILHDAEREEYLSGIELFNKLEEWGGTVVLRRK